MKKIISIILCICLVAMGIISYAEDEVNIELDFPYSVKIQEGEKEVVLTLSIQSLTGIPNEASIGYQANVKYDKSIFSDLKIKKVNENSKWDINYNASTGVLICELGQNSNISENMQIATFTFTLNDGISTTTTDVFLAGTEYDEATVTVQSGTAGTGIDFSKACEKTSIIRITAKENPVLQNQETSNGGSSNNNQAETKQEETKQEATPTTPVETQQSSPNIEQTQDTQNPSNVDNTTAKAVMPKTGAKTFFLIILSIIIVGIMYLIRYKKIQLK